MKIPAQMKSESESQKVTQASAAVQGSVVTAMAATFVVNGALGFGM